MFSKAVRTLKNNHNLMETWSPNTIPVFFIIPLEHHELNEFKNRFCQQIKGDYEKQAEVTNQSKIIWVAGLWCRSSGSASRHSAGCRSNVNLAWTPAQRESALVFDRRLYWCLRMQGGRAAEQRCSLFVCHRRECTTCSTCWVGCSWTSGFLSQRKWWGFLAPCSRLPLV